MDGAVSTFFGERAGVGTAVFSRSGLGFDRAVGTWLVLFLSDDGVDFYL